MVDAEILAYYEHGLDRGRLAAGRQRIEFPRIWDLLERFLPAPPAKVLDVGGGAGAYAIPLAQAGYEVYLIDPVPLHTEQAAAASGAARLPLASISIGDARDLAVAGRGFDAVVLLGPLYHLTNRPDRLAALREARRALPPPAAASNSSRACPSSWTPSPPAITSCRCSGSWRPSRRSSA